MKKITHKDLIKDWEYATDSIAEEFARKYFGRDAELWWVADQVGGVLFINDYFFNIDRMVDSLKYKATRKQMFDYYDMELEHMSTRKNDHPVNPNYKNFIKYGPVIFKK